MSEKEAKYTGRKAVWIPVLMGLLLVVLILTAARKPLDPEQKEQHQNATISAAEMDPGAGYKDTEEKMLYFRTADLEITEIGSYTGVYMEDGSDEAVSGVLMIVVTNTAPEALEYAEIILSGESGDAIFMVSALPAGESAVLLERNRMPYDKNAEFTQLRTENVAYFRTELSLMEDVLKIQALDGAVNVTNISDRDIHGDIFICYKNKADDLFYGGIAYRIRIEGGLKSGEIRQIMTKHFSENSTSLIYISVVE